MKFNTFKINFDLFIYILAYIIAYFKNIKHIVISL